MDRGVDEMRESVTIVVREDTRSKEEGYDRRKDGGMRVTEARNIDEEGKDEN
jgi:hypothetical protein